MPATAKSPLHLPPRRPVSQAVDIAVSMTEAELRAALAGPEAVLSEEEALRLLYDWQFWARPEQLAPPGDWRLWLLKPGRGFGKGLALDTPIPMPGQWKWIRDIQDGDWVWGLRRDRQQETRVTKAHPPYLPQHCFRVWFSDGSSVVADGDHLWTIERTWISPGLFERPEVDRLWTLSTWDLYNRGGGMAQFFPVPLPETGHRGGRRYITAIEPTPKTWVRCLTVDATDGLYLAGSTEVPTHNTRTGAQWTIQRAHEGKGPITLIGQSAFDTREVMIKGPSGIIPNSPPWFKPIYESSKRLLTWPNGVVAYCFSGDEPEQQKGPNIQSGWIDEFCLAGRVLLSTENGPILIGQIRPGMRVWTRRGLRPVVHWEMTNPDAEVYDVLMSNGQTLTGTFNHPVWVQGMGFIPLGQLGQGDRLLCFAKDRECGGMDECGTATTVDTTEVEKEQERHLNSIGKSGNSPTAPSPRGCTSTTSTRMSETTTPITLRQSLTENTPASTQELWLSGAKARKAGKSSLHQPKNSGRKERGVHQKPGGVLNVGPITKPTPVALPVTVLSDARTKPITLGRQPETAQQLKPAKSATSSLPAPTSESAPAPCLVGLPLGDAGNGPRRLNSTNNALSAAPPLSPEAMLPATVPRNAGENQEVYVLRVSLSPIRQPVYNIEVADCPEYFANGILTHNCKFRFAEQTWNQFSFTLRYGSDPRAVITTTPRPIRIFKQLMADPKTYVTHGTLYDNAANLNPDFIADIKRRYEGTRMGREMILGQVVDDVPGALWRLTQIDLDRVKIADTPTLRQIVVGVDPSSKDYDPEQSEDDREGSECGIIVAGTGGYDDHGYVLHDGSDNLSPREWAERVVELFYKFRANWVIAERNNGGGMVRETIHAVDDTVPVLLVWASNGKDPRAEPVSLLYEQHRVHHVGTLADLEDQMCGFVPREKKRPPKDRMDALVWAMKHLMLGDDRIPHYDPTKHRVSGGRRAA